MVDTSSTRVTSNPGWRAASAVVSFVWLSLVAVGCVSSDATTEQPIHGHPVEEISAEAFARDVVALIAEREINLIAEKVNPDEGVTFSPYGFVNPNRAVTLEPADLVSAWGNDRIFVWGSYDGSGEPIRLSTSEYFDHFVYDKNFSKAAQIAVDRVIGRGNTLVNHDEVFVGATVVEFFVPGTDPRYGGMDWASLRVVLVKRPGGGWWLRALIHDQWTI